MFESKQKYSQTPSSKPFVPDFSRTPVTTTPTNTKQTAESEAQERDPSVAYAVAGEREVAKYTPTVSISSARSMFEKTKPDEYVPKNKFIPTYTRSSNPTTAVSESDDTPPQNSDVVRACDTIDDRPKELTTSLLSARAMFENSGNGGSSSGNTPSKRHVPVATWEGKESGSSVMNSAKAVFQGDGAVKTVEAVKVDEEQPAEEQEQQQQQQEVEEHSEEVEKVESEPEVEEKQPEAEPEIAGPCPGPIEDDSVEEVRAEQPVETPEETIPEEPVEEEEEKEEEQQKAPVEEAESTEIQESPVKAVKEEKKVTKNNPSKDSYDSEDVLSDGKTTSDTEEK